MIDRGNHDRRSPTGLRCGVLLNARTVCSPSTIMPGEKLSDDWTHVFPAVAAAYEACLEVEKELMRQQTSILTATDTKALEKKLVNIRILGYLLIFAPTNTAREHIAKTILADKDGDSDALTNRGGFYDQLFLRTCKISPSHNLPWRSTPGAF